MKKWSYDPRWDDYKTWLADVGRRPTKFHCFTRIDTTKNWTPDNVHWLYRGLHEQYDVEDHFDEHVSYPKIYQNPYKTRVITKKI